MDRMDCLNETNGEAVGLLTTYRCNLNCKYCYVQTKRNKDMSLDMAKSILEPFLMKKAGRLDITFIGGVEFDKFSTDENGNVIENANGLPSAAYYKFYANNPTLKPMFCVQPLYYILSYITNQYEDNKQKGNVFKRFVSTLFNLFSSDGKLFEAMKELGQYKLKDGKGYEIIQGEEMLK